MKKFLGVLVALTMCVCLLAPMAMAADEASPLTDLFEGMDIGNLNVDEISSILGGLDLENFDVDQLISDAQSGDTGALGQLEDALSNLGLDSSDDDAAADDTAADADSIPTIGGLDLTVLTDALSGVVDTSALTDLTSMFEGFTGDSGSLMDTIGGALAGLGIDTSMLEGLDVGSFDVSNLGGAGSEGVDTEGVSGTVTDGMSSFMDTIMSGLTSLGLDTSVIEGLLDNDIVNFFANMYVGFIGGQPDPEPTTTAIPTTTKPPVVTTKTPDTGDTSSVVVALATLTVASAAAFVCLKKKED